MKEDAPDLLDLMRELATFEGYIDRFQVREQDLIDRGLGASPAFTCFVAVSEEGQKPIGMSVNYFVPFTYDLKPTAILKELFVAEAWRGSGVGKALFERTREWARQEGCSKMRWDVLDTNDAAMAFYRRLGGRPFAPWQSWTLDFT